MRKPYSDAYNVLKVMGVPVFTNADNDRLGNFFVDGEARNSDGWVNYHFAPPHWDFGVHPAVCDVLNSFGLMCEWVNPSLLGVRIMTPFEWCPTPRGIYNYITLSNDRSNLPCFASVYPQRDHYRVITAHYLDELIPAKAYILNHKYPTLAAAKRAVERKIPPLFAVIKMQGGIKI